MYYVEVSGFGWINTEVYVAKREGFTYADIIEEFYCLYKFTIKFTNK